MYADAHKDHHYLMDNFLNYIPKNRWMLLPFLKKIRPPPKISEIHPLMEIMSISDTNILELLAINGLVKISRAKISKEISRIVYTDETKWNNAVTNGNVTISIEQFSKYQYISLWQAHPSSQTKHTVADVKNGIIQYDKLISTRGKMRLAKVVGTITTECNIDADGDLMADAGCSEVGGHCSGGSEEVVKVDVALDADNVGVALYDDFDEGGRTEGESEAVHVDNIICLGESEEVFKVNVALDANNVGVAIHDDFNAEGGQTTGESEATRHQLYPILSRLGLIPSSCPSEDNDNKPQFAEVLTEVLQYWWEFEKKSGDDILKIPCCNNTVMKMIPL